MCGGGSGDVEIFHCHRRSRGYVERFHWHIEGLGRGMWKDFVAINGSECVRALICIAIDDPLGGGRREQSSALTPTSNRLYIGSGSKSY